jgi:hypothetical protein
MTDELVEIGNGMDLAPLLGEREKTALDGIDTLIQSSIIQGDPSEIFSFGRGLWKAGHMNSLMLAKLLSKASQQWQMFQMGDNTDRFEDAVQAEIGISPQTTRKYSQLWDNVFDNENIPIKVRLALYGMPIKSLLLLTGAARDGDQLDWEKVAAASNGSEIRDMVREVRGERTSSKTSTRIKMDRFGQLTVLPKGGSPYGTKIGTLDVNLAEKDPEVKRAITRIVERSGILWQ